MSINKKVTKLCVKRLRFGKVLKIVEKYRKAKPYLVCLSCISISHDYLGGYGNQAI